MKTEKEKMLAGELYSPRDRQLFEERCQSRHFAQSYNTTRPEEIERRREILQQWFGKIGETVEIEPPFYCDYGRNLFLGDRVYFNFNCIVLDCNRVEIGSDVLLGPGVQIYTATHPVDPKERRSGQESAAAIKIGNNVWIGGNVVICPGVTIGDRTTIGAGSVVVKDIPANVVAVGNPCRAIRELGV